MTAAGWCEQRAAGCVLLASPDPGERHSPANFARFVFTDASVPEFYVDSAQPASDSVAMLHVNAGRHPEDRDLADLIGDFSAHSE